MANTNFDREWEHGQEAVRQANAERRAEEARQKRAEQRESQRAAKRESTQRSKSLPWICRFDNALHDFLKQPRNY